MKKISTGSSIPIIQDRDSNKIIDVLNKFWGLIREKRNSSKATPGILEELPNSILCANYPLDSNSLENVMNEVNDKILPYCINSSNPLFLGYVTPPALDITCLGNALIAMLNQNVSFSVLSPAGTAIEKYVIQALCIMVGYTKLGGGILVSGGSTANLQALITARRMIIGKCTNTTGNYSEKGALRIYCSTQIHRSIHKAAIVMGIGVQNVVDIECDENHQIKIHDLYEKIKKDKESGMLPMAIVGAAGTRTCGSFDNIKALHEIAEEFKIWLHVDGAFGAFLKIAENGPADLEFLNLAHSITLDPHKLLFMPFDSGCLLVKNKQQLIDAFGSGGEYLEKFHSEGEDYCDLGIQLGRSMKSLNIWLALRYFGLNTYQKEYERLLKMAIIFKNIIDETKDFELIGPSQSIIICFRYNPDLISKDEFTLNSVNETIRTSLIREGKAFINGVSINGRFALRVCLANYNTTIFDLQNLLEIIRVLTENVLLLKRRTA